MSKIRNYLGRNLNTKRTKDKLTIERRSLLMSKIHSRKTTLELDFFKQFKKQGLSFTTHPKGILGNPDLIVKTKKVCLFIDSDFWHGWQYPRWKYKLKNKFWRNKIEKNKKRDKKVTSSLQRKGWHVFRVWEHSLKDTNKLDSLIKSIYKVN